MQQNRISILSTSALEQVFIDKASTKNISIESISFIETEMIIDSSLKHSIINLSAKQLTVVFTSMNAVNAVVKNLDNIKPNWKIFCIGKATKEIISNYFGESTIAVAADSASALAGIILKDKNIVSVVFFCGDSRRNELPEKLAAHKIELNEIVVYKTMATPQAVKKDYDAIIFYSPSGVESFFSINKINKDSILFAIGDTTAAEIKRYNTNKIIVGETLGKAVLVEQAVKYFQTNTIHSQLL